MNAPPVVALVAPPGGTPGYCRRCGRPLLTPASQARNIGPKCAALAVAALAAETHGLDRCDLPWDPVTEDVVCRREHDDPYRLHVNVPLLDNTIKQGGYEWGYGGTGPAMFALNILLWFGVPLAAAIERGRYHDFKFRYVATLPREGGTIPGPTIRRWIADRIVPVSTATDSRGALTPGGGVPA